MADIIYKMGKTIVTGVALDRITRGNTTTTDFSFLHNSKNDIEVLGMFITPHPNTEANPYGGDSTPNEDYNSILYWGNQWGKGLTLVQYDRGTPTRSLIQSGVGSSKGAMIALVQNDGVVSARGKRISTLPTIGRNVQGYVDNLASPHAIDLLTDLTGYTSLYRLTQSGILTGGSDTIDVLAPRVIISADENGTPVIDPGTGEEVFGVLRTNTATEANLMTSQEMDGLSDWFVLTLFSETDMGFSSYSATSPFYYQYKIMEPAFYDDEVSLAFELEVPPHARESVKVQFGFDISFRELV